MSLTSSTEIIQDAEFDHLAKSRYAHSVQFSSTPVHASSNIASEAASASSSSSLSESNIDAASPNIQRPSNDDENKGRKSSDLAQLWVDLQSKDLARRKAFIIRYTKALGDAGAPAHRTEARSLRVANLLGLGEVCQIVAFPLFVLCSFCDQQLKTTADTHVIRVSPSGHQSHLDRVDALADKINAGEFDFDCPNCRSSSASSSLSPGVSRYASVVASRRPSFDGNDEQAEQYFAKKSYDIVTDVDPSLALSALNDILNSPLPWRKPFLALAGFVLSFIAPLFWFGSGFADASISGALGTAVICFGFLADAYPRILSHVYPMACAFLCGFVAMISGSSRCQTAISLGGILWLIPGLNITVGVIELSTRHPVSGTSRMFTAMMYIVVRFVLMFRVYF